MDSLCPDCFFAQISMCLTLRTSIITLFSCQCFFLYNFFFFFCLFFLPFLGPFPRHMEVSMLGVQSEL